MRHMQHAANYRVVSPGTDRDWNWEIRGHFIQTVLAKHERILRSYTADSWAYMDNRNISISDRAEEREYATSTEYS